MTVGMQVTENAPVAARAITQHKAGSNRDGEGGIGGGSRRRRTVQPRVNPMA